MQSLTQASSVPGAGAAPAAAGAPAAGAFGACVDFGCIWPAGAWPAASWADANGAASAKPNAAALAQSAKRAALRFNEFQPSLDQIIIDLSSFRGLVQVN
jgi:hypothetical protein